MVEKRDLDIIFNNSIDWEVFRDKRILVTAATGRLGMYIVEALVKADLDYNLNMRVIAHARNEKKLNTVFGNTLELPNVEPLIQDIIEEIRLDGPVDYIFHTAGPAAPKDFTETPVETLWAHVSGTHNVLELAKEKKSERVVYISTVEIYGENVTEEDFKETDMGVIRCDNARSCYPEAKRLCETMLASYEAEYGISYVGARMSHTFGPGITLEDGRSFSEFIGCALKGEDIILHSDGSAVRPYTYVADAIGGVLMIATKGEKNTYYNIANLDNQASVKEVAQVIADLAPRGKTKVVFENEGTKLQYLNFKLGVMNTDKIRNLGWRPGVDLKSAFRYTIESFEQNR